MRTIQTTVIIIMMICAGNILANTQEKSKEYAIKATLQFIKERIIAVCLNPVVISIASCIPETYCYYEHFNKQEQYYKCTWYVLKCILRKMKGKTSCLSIVGNAVFIEWYKYGTYINNYDYIKIALGVLECTGVDEWTRNYIKKNFWG